MVELKPCRNLAARRRAGCGLAMAETIPGKRRVWAILIRVFLAAALALPRFGSLGRRGLNEPSFVPGFHQRRKSLRRAGAGKQRQFLWHDLRQRRGRCRDRFPLERGCTRSTGVPGGDANQQHAESDLDHGGWERVSVAVQF